MPNMPDAPPESYEPIFGSETPRNLRVYSHTPEMAKAFAALAGTATGPGTDLPDRLKELVRLRVAFHNQCCSCMAVRYLPEDEVSGGLSARWRSRRRPTTLPRTNGSHSTTPTGWRQTT